MITVWKYLDIPVDKLNDRETVTLPAGAEILSVVNRREHLCLYARVNAKAKATERHALRIVGTGHPAVLGHKFLGTVVFAAGGLVFHIFLE